jgi:glutathione peroxidase
MFYDFIFDKVDGSGKILLSDYAGKVVLVSNTASACGFTPQYAELEALWKKYKDRGLIVIGVPSDDFGGQEPLNNTEIGTFCELNFGVTFLITQKLHVTGKEAHPFFLWTKKEFGFLAGPKWNFYKFLIGKNGEPIEWFSSFRSPLSKNVTDLIEKNLP